MTVTAIQIGLHPDAVDYESPEFSQFTGPDQGEVDQGQQRQRRRPARGRLRGRQLPHRVRRSRRAEGPHVAGGQALRRRADRRGRPPRRKQHRCCSRRSSTRRTPPTPTADSCSTTRRPRHPTTSAAGTRTRPTPLRRRDHGYLAQRRRSRRRRRAHRIDRGRRPGPVRPLGRRPRTLARYEPVQPRLRDDGPHAGGARCPRPGRRRPRARAPGTGRLHLRRCPNRPDASAFGLPVRGGHATDQRRPCARRTMPPPRVPTSDAASKWLRSNRIPMASPSPHDRRMTTIRRTARHGARRMWSALTARTAPCGIWSARNSRARRSCRRWCSPTSSWPTGPRAASSPSGARGT